MVGWSNTELETNSKNNNGFYLGMDKILTYENGFGFGVGIDLNGFKTDMVGVTDGSAAYTLGGQVKVGYTFEKRFNIPLKVKAGYGYGVTRLNSSQNAWGTQYDVSAEYAVYKSIGFGVKYKSANADLHGVNLSVDSTIVYLSIQ